NGTTTITYTVSDGNGNTDTAEVAVDVTPVNDDPVAEDDTATTEEGEPVTIPVLDNDTDVDGDPLEVIEATSPDGTVEIDPVTGELTFTPEDDFTGTTTITYTITDGNGGTDSAVVTVNVTPDDNTVDAVDDSYTTDEDTAIIVDLTDNDSDPEGDDFEVTSVGTPTNGTVELQPDGTVKYTPNEDFNGTDTFTYIVTDEHGATDEATVTITIDPVNDRPDGEDDVAVTPEDTPVVIDVIANDTDPEGDPLEVAELGEPENGTAELNPDGTVTYTPNTDFTGTDTFTYTVTDGNGGTDVVTVQVAVESDEVNEVDAVDDLSATETDTPVVIDVLANDNDPEGDDFEVTDVEDPANGTAELNANGTITYTPDTGFTGTETFTYTVTDEHGATDVATVTVIVSDDPNLAPDAVDDTAETPEDTPVVIDVLANDTDPDDDPLTVTDATSPEGTVEIDPVTGELTFTPEEDFTGTATITYTVSDGNGETDTAVVTVNVTPVNDAPDTNPDDTSTLEGTPVEIPVLANDSDPEGDPLEVIDTTDPTHGTVSVNPDGTIEYTPEADYTGTDTFTYTVSDGNGGTATDTVTIDVLPDGTNTVDAVNDEYVVPEDTSIIVDLTENDSDPEGDDFSVTSITQPSHGTAELLPDGTVQYTPEPNFEGTDIFTYTVTDEFGATDVATVSLTVPEVEDDPDAEDDLDVTAVNTPVTIDVLANDEDPDGDDLSVSDTTDPDHGTLSVNPDGTIEYTPEADFTGTDTFTYTVTDGNGNTDIATVTVVVEPDGDNRPPVATDDEDRTPIETPVVIDVLANDSDPDGDDLTVLEATTPDGTVEIDPVTGELTFTPADDFTGPATITYTIADEEGLTDTATVTVMVNDGIVEGTDGADVIDAGYTGDPEGDLVEGEDNIFSTDPEDANDDIIEAYGGDDIVDAGEGDDHVDGGDGDDIIDGGEGDDTIIGGQGADTVDGGDGDDVIDTSGPNPASDHGITDPTDPLYAVAPLDDDPNDDKDVVDGGAGDDTITTGDDADIIDGGEGDDTIDGGLDDDEIDGGEGDDFIIGGHGADDIDGGDGDDEIWGGLGPDATDLLNIPDDVDPRPENGIDTIHGGDGDDVIYGQDDDDVLYGDEGDDTIDGGIDEDMIFGGEGDDVLLGGAGDDIIDGGEGEDEAFGGDDRDTFLNVGPNDYVDGNEGGDDWDTLDLRGSAPVGGGLKVTKDPDNEENGVVEFFDDEGNSTGTMEFYNIEDVVPCFTPGTLIATPKGERLVEELQMGDKVITRDNGIQEIRWIGAKPMDWKTLNSNEHLKPVLIRAGSLGNGLPERDMLVSPNHRILVANDRTALYFDEREVLASAKHLVDNKTISTVDVKDVTYIHFMFDHHEVVLSDGAWTESFQPGDYSLKGIGNSQRQELFELFPELETQEGIEDFSAARRVLKKHEAQMLLKK
ncbi:MAG: Ig-like domain-containing protein, partial [Maritimibacter sp.]